ncbi:peptidase M13 [Emticicia oligotrophica DSM 17448]|uniref:Peptidase M13 n=1 Tax=Emticicia oligotrophica (strain DSM 17448 / CIP 109782 / MTCC 6937 / GPTSA100-15) TaxID=929562 RepID=A0ABM5MZX2_EMTOG|nr:M13 family metallopeptidase [Emticicia oligotrophica]AFK02646.1 peptidase M13 [Emticicia oligotrophica DSM 17448]
MKKHLSLLLILCFFLTRFNTSFAQKVSITGIDTSLKPGDDFFMYVNGKWYNSVEIPSTQSGVGSYSFMNYPQRIRLQGILDSVSAAKNPMGSIEQKVGDFYASGMDTATINKRGFNPIKPMLKQIDGIKDIAGIMKYVTAQLKFNNYSLIGFRVGPDIKNSSINIVNLSQTGIGLPERDYYFRTDSSTRFTQKSYQNYLSTLLKLTGVDASMADKMATAAYAIERELAASHKTNIERRNVQANYNKLAVTAITQRQPNIGWPLFFKELGVKVDSVNMQQPAYYDRLNGLLTSVSIEDWKAYLRTETLVSYADFLSKPFTKASFEYAKVLSGQATQKPRGEEITEAVDRSLGHGLAQLYVKKYFPEEAKRRMKELVKNLKTAFENRITNLDWMSDSTKAKAKEKLYAFTEKIGYPDKWRDYSKVVINRGTYFENRLATSKNDFIYGLSKIGQPVDRTEWGTTPPTVTAYNNPPLNEIVFPAGILQPPYFDMNADDALNYGGIGMVIGHEITHSFDDQGALYDKQGNVKNWWKADDFKKFKAKTQLVIEQYNKFTVLDSMHVKGALTVGENTADIAGIAIAYDAFKLTEQAKSNEKIDGFTPEQRFFISIARIWRVKTKDAFMRTYVNTNPHSPAKWRVNGPLMNFTPFYKAFDVKPGDKMYKPESERITVW